jgi:hypothetical protein
MLATMRVVPIAKHATVNARQSCVTSLCDRTQEAIDCLIFDMVKSFDGSFRLKMATRHGNGRAQARRSTMASKGLTTENKRRQRLPARGSAREQPRGGASSAAARQFHCGTRDLPGSNDKNAFDYAARCFARRPAATPRLAAGGFDSAATRTDPRHRLQPVIRWARNLRLRMIRNLTDTAEPITVAVRPDQPPRRR